MIDTKIFKTQNDLYNFLINRLNNYPAAIMAGHFMLYYDGTNQSLVPLIYQDLGDGEIKEIAQLYAGEFPIKSFKIGLDIISDTGVSSKIVFLVNDHKFQDINFQPENRQIIDSDAGRLRQYFYSEYGIKMPKTYYSILHDTCFKFDDTILLNNDLSRQKQDILPKETIYFSEQALRNRFENTIRNDLKNNPNFYVNGVDIFYAPTLECLTKEGKCGCSGEIMEFLHVLEKKGYKNVVLISPNECVEPIRTACEAYVLGFESSLNVFQIHGVGGIGGIYENDKQLLIDVILRNNEKNN